MGFFSKFFFSWDANKEIASKAFPRFGSLKKIKYRTGINQLWQACIIVGDRFFPSLNEIKLFNKVPSSGLLVASIVCFLLGVILYIGLSSLLNIGVQFSSAVRSVNEHNQVQNTDQEKMAREAPGSPIINPKRSN